MKTNRNYFSWSQYYLWNTSKTQFYKRYVLGENQKENIRFSKGKELGLFLEHGGDPESYSTDPNLPLVGSLCPKLDLMEDKLEFEVLGVNMLSYVDSAKITNEFFLEYKTGKEPWDQDRVNEHQQLDWYALGYWMRSSDDIDKRIVPSCQLVWVETKDVEVEEYNDDEVPIVLQA